MKTGKIICLVFFVVLLLLTLSFKYTVEINPNNGDRTVTYGIPNIYQVSYYDKAIDSQISNPYEGILTPKTISSYKSGAAIVVIIIGTLVCVIL